MAKASITKRTVDAAKPADRDQLIWDKELSGFGLKVTPAGSKVYVFQYRMARPGMASSTAAKRYTIGKHGKLTPDQARSRAKELAAMVELGTDPKKAELDAIAAEDERKVSESEKARLEGELAFGRIADQWLDQYEHEKQRRPSSVRQARLVIENHLRPILGSKPFPHIGRGDLQPIIDSIPAKQQAMRRAVFAYSSVLFGWAAKRGIIDSNPLASMERPEKPRARDRVLDDRELAAIFEASSEVSAKFGSFFRLLILTGQRRSEVAAIDWRELDREAAIWTIPAARSKNDNAHLVPLPRLVIEELDKLAGDKETWPPNGLVLTSNGKTPISGIGKAKLGLDTAIATKRDGQPIEPWRIHDIRRTLATGMQRLGVRFEVTEAILNHLSGSRGGVAGVYQKHDWKEEKASALYAWSKHVQALLAPSDSTNVLQIAASINRVKR